MFRRSGVRFRAATSADRRSIGRIGRLPIDPEPHAFGSVFTRLETQVEAFGPSDMGKVQRLQPRLGWLMSVDPRESSGEIWTGYLGQLVDGAFPLRRLLGNSVDSAVFLSESRTAKGTEVALKLVRATADFAESQLANWRTASGLTHPHLIGLFETGRCHIEARPYLYAVMEYADQSLAQVLQQRALTEEEAREMLLPALAALGFLHGRDLIQGQVKPGNILAVGDRLKLASDTIRRRNSAGARRGDFSLYDPPEARDAGYSSAGDIWGLGVSLFEALTRSSPAGLRPQGRGLEFPSDFPPVFRELVARCLSRRPSDRPTATEIEASLRRPVTVPARSAAAAPVTVASTAKPASAPASATSETVAPARPPASGTAHARVARTGVRPTSQTAARTAERTAERLRSAASRARPLVPLILGAVLVATLGWAAIRALGTHRSQVTSVAKAPEEASLPLADAGRASPQPVSSGSNTKPTSLAATTPTAGIHEEIPDVPRHARQTIHGHVRVSVRVIVDGEGAVVAALVDDPGPSRYFERLASDAAKKWTFPPEDTQARRLKLVRFEFTREGTKGRAVSLE